jgi:hypothetical protein
MLRWMKLGEEYCKFFHAMAIEIYMRNVFCSFLLPDGHVVSDYDQMVFLGVHINKKWAHLLVSA